MKGTGPVIPCLQLQGDSLVSTTHFRQPRHIGNPAEALRMFDRAGAQEIILLDIMASRKQGLSGSKATGKPDVDLVACISEECSVPVTCGGGIRTVEDIRDVKRIGVEKVLIGTRAIEDPSFVGRASDVFGSRGIAVAIDAKRLPDSRYEVCANGGTVQTGIDPVSHAQHMESMGVGEIFLNSIDRDGTLCGYDLPLIRSVTRAVSIPVIACGGAGCADDFHAAIQAGASAAAASSVFIFKGCRGTMHLHYPAGTQIKGMQHDAPETAVAEGR